MCTVTLQNKRTFISFALHFTILSLIFGVRVGLTLDLRHKVCVVEAWCPLISFSVMKPYFVLLDFFCSVLWLMITGTR